MFKKILIANRGEIAVRIARACREMGIASVAIYSEADESALHVRAADEAVCCGPARAAESYLDAARIVGIAREVGADAVHPGYGFLSENAGFARAVTDAGITFIGPTPEVIAAMGLKIAARERMVAAGVPVVPGGEEIKDPAVARMAAAEIGYPVLVKASAGGGGRGMRRVDNEADLEVALERASSEAEAAFGDGAVYLEKCLIGPRHIEIQVMADAYGHTLHFGERECSIQRRHQKLVEEAPAYGMTVEMRAAMGEAAVLATQAVDYVGAGTCEFLLDARGEFYFLEMNTRIQVEHPVTESVTGVDLVAMQIRMAAGERLELEQDNIRLTGHAIEVRIYAEDPDKGFIPSPGPIVDWRAPEGDGVRLDTGFEGGETVTPHYDPMIAKLIVSGCDRQEVLARLEKALETYVISGIRTGLPFLRRVCENAAFREGAYDTSFIETHMPEPAPALSDSKKDEVIAAVAYRASRNGDTSGPFEIALPKSDAIRARASSDSSKGMVVVDLDGRSVDFEVLEEAGSILNIRFMSGTRLMTIVARKKGGFDVGLRDRVLRVKCKAVNADDS